MLYLDNGINNILQRRLLPFWSRGSFSSASMHESLLLLPTFHPPEIIQWLTSQGAECHSWLGVPTWLQISLFFNSHGLSSRSRYYGGRRSKTQQLRVFFSFLFIIMKGKCFSLTKLILYWQICNLSCVNRSRSVASSVSVYWSLRPAMRFLSRYCHFTKGHASHLFAEVRASQSGLIKSHEPRCRV